MGSTDSLDTFATCQDLESITSGSSGWVLTGSSPSPEVELNKENSSSQVTGSSPSLEVGLNIENSSSQVADRQENLRERESNKQALPTDRKEKVAGGKKDTIDAPKPRFKRKFSSISLSQPICGTEFELGETTNWKIEYKKQAIEYKKQAQLAKKMRIRAHRAEEKLQLVRSQLKKIFDIVMK